MSNIKIDNQEKKAEILNLSKDIVDDIELSRIPLSNIVLKAIRLAKICGDEDMEKVFKHESSGYSYGKDDSDEEIWRLLEIGDRVRTDKETGEKLAYFSSICENENIAEASRRRLSVCNDPNYSISSANPNQYVWNTNHTNLTERQNMSTAILTSSNILSTSKTLIYRYAFNIYYELKFSNLTETIWSSFKEKTDKLISDIAPDEVKKLSAIYDNLNDTNPEKWSGALTSCRKMLKSIADILYPPKEESILKDGKKIKLGGEEYINRLMRYVEQNSSSETSEKITNSNLDYIGTRLDTINKKACKGVHNDISKDEAERCFMYTFLVIGDILSIANEKKQNNPDVNIKIE
ncbi:MAG: hypothetical protein PHY80_02165 [Rickettsiales bacterium]|nr:hypothetical protein [Rickettsiales bacterium]